MNRFTQSDRSQVLRARDTGFFDRGDQRTDDLSSYGRHSQSRVAVQGERHLAKLRQRARARHGQPGTSDWRERTERSATGASGQTIGECGQRSQGQREGGMNEYDHACTRIPRYRAALSSTPHVRESLPGPTRRYAEYVVNLRRRRHGATLQTKDKLLACLPTPRALTPDGLNRCRLCQVHATRVHCRGSRWASRRSTS
jgi:hypothetical protein